LPLKTRPDYQSANGDFDLLYGFAASTAAMSATLEDALTDFREHLEAKNPGAVIALGQLRPLPSNKQTRTAGLKGKVTSDRIRAQRRRETL